MTPSEAEAEDVAQEALVRGWRMRRQCREPAQYLAWLGQIARREALRFHNRRRPLVLLEEHLHPTVEDAASELSTRLSIASMLLELDPRDRELLRLRYEEDLTYAQIARRLETPVGTAKVRLHRLKVRLRTRLTEAECR
jgi:RNA polymerase sigma-70 factor, ECF subfamily